MPSSKGKVHCKDSTSNLLRLFNSGLPDNRVVTRRDLATDYPCNDDNCPRTSNSDGVVTINNHYTWNSPRTNSSIRKERAEIVSALHSVKSASEVRRGPTTCNSFTRSHGLREIMSMCADRRGDFSTDDYQRNDHGNSSGNAVETDTNDVATASSTGGATANRRSWTSSYIGGTSRCWSCTATDRESDDDDDDVDEGHDNSATTDGAHCRRTNRQLSWIRKLNLKFRNSRDSR